MGAPFLLAPPWAFSIAASARSTPFGLLPSPLRRTLVSATSSSPCPCPVQQQGGCHHQGSPTLHSYSANWLLQHQLLTITSRITHLTWGHVTGGCMQHAVISSPYRAPRLNTHSSSAVTTTQRCTGRGQLKARWASTRTLPPTPHICTGHLQQPTVALQRQQWQAVYRRTLIGGLSRRRRRPVRPALFLINTRRRLPCSCASAIVVIRCTHMAMRAIAHC